jgi:hypothetical protein
MGHPHEVDLLDALPKEKILKSGNAPARTVCARTAETESLTAYSALLSVARFGSLTSG